MAMKGKDFFNVDYCFAFTGNAGPSAMDNKPVGLVYVSINTDVYELNFGNISRNEIREKAVQFAMEKLKEIMQN